MKRGKTAIIALSIIFSMTIVMAPAINSQTKNNQQNGTPPGWSDDINLSNNPLRDQECRIAINNENIHAVWIRHTVDVIYQMSNDNGKSWKSMANIYHSTYIIDPDIAVSGQNVHVVIKDYNGWDGIYYINSTNNGESWNSTKRINPDGLNAYSPYIFVNNSNVHIIWDDVRDGADGEIYYRRSLDGGIIWDNGQGVDTDRRITYSPSTVSDIDMAGDKSNISVIWGDERNGQWELYWMISKDNGYTWENGLGNIGQDRRLTTTGDFQHTIAVNGSNIYIVYTTENWPGPMYNIYYLNSSDNGATWNPPVLLSGPNTASFAPNIAVFGNNIWISWNDNRDGSYEIFCKNSTDRGVTWSNDTRLTEMDGFDSGGAKIGLSGNITHVTWEDYRNGSYEEIYYKRFPDFPPLPFFKIPVVAGWNLISSPLNITATALPSALLDSDGDTIWDRIQWYDPLDASNHWKQYNVGWNSTLNDLSSFDFAKGIWLNVTSVGDGY